MQTAFILDFASGKTSQYDRVMELMELDGRLPEGCQFHAAGAFAGGLRVVDIWESPEAFQRFAETQIGPFSAQAGITEEPRITAIGLREMLRGTAEPIGFLHVVRMPGLDAAGFDALQSQVRGGRPMPDGNFLHAHGPTDDGYAVIDVFTAQAERDRFIEERVMPVMAAAGVADAPIFEDLDVHNSLTRAAVGAHA